MHTMHQANPPPNATAQPWALCTTDLAVQRGERTLLSGVALQLRPGSVTWLRGRNGRGKTSLLRVLAGLSSPLGGEIRLGGQTQREAGPAWRRQLAFIGHHNALKDELSVSEALRFLAQLHGLPADDASLGRALQCMGILHRRHAPVRSLSQGQRRRAALARLALSGAARLWLLDEPFDALDTDGVAALAGLIGDFAAQGGCVLLTSHQAPALTQPAPAVFDLDRHAGA